MSPTVIFIIVLVITAVAGFYWGYWFEAKRKPRVKKKQKKDHL